jgi:limonene-1,2-epoxide hydrolase
VVQCFIFEVADGLIRQVRAYFDTASGFRQIFGDEPPRKLV